MTNVLQKQVRSSSFLEQSLSANFHRLKTHLVRFQQIRYALLFVDLRQVILTPFLMIEPAANNIEVARFEDGETLPTLHFLVDAKLEDSTKSSVGTFLLPSIVPEASRQQYAVVLDEISGIHHVARKGSVVYKDPKTPSKANGSKETSQGRVKEIMKDRFKAVEMPSEFETMSKNYTSMPNFRCFAEEPSFPSPRSSSVSIMEAFRDIFALAHGDQDRHDNASMKSETLSMNKVDTSIIEVGGAIQQVHDMITESLTSSARSTPGSESDDSAFFESLLAKKGSATEVVPKRTPSAKASRVADKVFSESLSNCNESVRDNLTALSPVDGRDSKPSTNLAQKYVLTATWVDVNMNDLPALPSSLGLAVTFPTTKPRLLFSELDLDVTPDQIHSLLEDVKPDACTNYAATESEDDKVHYLRPVASRKDAMSYEEYFPLRSRSSSASPSGTLASSNFIEKHLSQPSTNTSVTPGSKDDLTFVQKRKPLEEPEWLDLAKSFHEPERSKKRSQEIGG